MNFKLPTLDFSDILNIGLSVAGFYQNHLEINQQRRRQQSAYNIYKAQRDLNASIATFNFNQRLRAATRQASSMRAALAASGLSGGTAEDDIRRYEQDLIVSSF